MQGHLWIGGAGKKSQDVIGKHEWKKNVETKMANEEGEEEEGGVGWEEDGERK